MTNHFDLKVSAPVLEVTAGTARAVGKDYGERRTIPEYRWAVLPCAPLCRSLAKFVRGTRRGRVRVRRPRLLLIRLQCDPAPVAALGARPRGEAPGG